MDILFGVLIFYLLCEVFGCLFEAARRRRQRPGARVDPPAHHLPQLPPLGQIVDRR